MKVKLSQKGFTLIELLIVIAIIGILAAALMVAINPAQRLASARNARVRSDIANIASQANIFNTDTGINCAQGSYPTDFADAGLTCAPATTFMIDPAAGAYDIEAVTAANGACDASTAGIACASMVIEGPARPDGGATVQDDNPATAAVNEAGTALDANTVFCWRSALGRTLVFASEAACNP